MFNNMYAGYINVYQCISWLNHGSKKWLKPPHPISSRAPPQPRCPSDALHSARPAALLAAARTALSASRPDLAPGPQRTREKHGGDQLEWGKHGVNMVKRTCQNP